MPDEKQTELNVDVHFRLDPDEVESVVQKPLEKSVSEYEQSLNDTTSKALNNASSTFSITNPSTKSGESSIFSKENIDRFVVPSGIAAVTTIFGGALGMVLGGPIGTVVGVAIGEVIGIAIQDAFNHPPENVDATAYVQSLIDSSNVDQQAELAKLWAGNLGEVKENGDQVVQTVNNLNQTVGTSNQINQEQAIIQKENADALLEISDSQSTVAESNKELIKQGKSLDKGIKKNANNIETYEGNLVKADTAAEQLGENGLPKIAEGAEEAQKALSDIDLQKLLENFSPEQIANLFDIPVEQIKAQAEGIGDGFKEAADTAKSELDSLGVFASDIAANINDAFADLIFNGLKGNFDDIGDIASQNPEEEEYLLAA